MTTNFPTSLDTFVDPTASSNLNDPSVLHHVQHANLNDSVAALETKVGINGSADTSSLDYIANFRGLSSYEIVYIASGGGATGDSTFTYTPGSAVLADKLIIGNASHNGASIVAPNNLSFYSGTV